MRHKPVFLILFTFISTTLTSCTGLGQHSERGFAYKDIQIDTASATTGQGSTIQFKGNPLPLSGMAIQVGEPLRSVNVAKGDLSLIDVTETGNSVRLINVVPSLDTTVCEQQKQLSE